MSPISKLKAEIAGEREKIWLDAPAELETLKQMQKGLAGNYSVRFYAVGDTYRNQRNIWLIRSLIQAGQLDLAAVQLLLPPLLQEAADRFEIWQLHSPSRFFRKAEKAVDAFTSTDEVVALLDELLIYNNRWWLWLDSSIAWFDLDKKLKWLHCLTPPA
ncbi:MAG: hypothetical protein JSW26_15045 [Desulfobacterales bacterium]|nr:MAG: hypothetical protein JSW26_15045 [Desulfobacterales bacterium]